MITTMSVKEILALPSVDAPVSFSETVASLMPHKTDELGRGGNCTSDEYDDIRSAMRRNGINEIPIHVAKGYDLAPCYGTICDQEYTDRLVMGNGHHRVALAIQLGHEYMRVTDRLDESGWENYV